jgi:hypothetical protein
VSPPVSPARLFDPCSNSCTYVAIAQLKCVPFQCCGVRDSPNAEKIMEILMEAREMFAETHDEEKFRLPPYAYDMRPDVEFPRR